MLNLSIRDISSVQRMLSSLSEKQIPFAISSALNSTGFQLLNFQKARIPTVFDRPTPFIVSSTRVEKATKKNLKVVIYIDTKRQVILKPHEFGGGRGNTQFEKFLITKGFMPSGYKILPDTIKLNAYGNITNNNRLAIMNGLHFKNKYFVIKVGAKQDRTKTIAGGGFVKGPGIYDAKNKKRLISFVSNATYRERFEFEEGTRKKVIEIFPTIINDSIRRAIDTAR